MKKTLTIIFTIMFTLWPTFCMASTLKDIAPEVMVEGIDLNLYNMNKIIDNDTVTVTLENKTNGLTYSWSFDRNKLGEVLALNFEVNFDSPLKAEIDEKSRENEDKLYLSFLHHGELPSEANIKLDVSNKYSDGTKLYLYYYNEDNKEIEYIDHDIEVVDGYVEFEIDHCSEYFLTATIVNDATNNPKSMNTIIIVLVGVVVILAGAAIFSARK